MLLEKIYFACNGINSNSLEFISDFTSGILISMKNTNIIFLGNSHTARKSRKICVFTSKKQKPYYQLSSTFYENHQT